MNRILFLLGAFDLILAALAPAAAWYVEKHMTREVILISPGSPETVELEKAMWEKGQPVADIYGKPLDKKILVVRPDPRDIIVPEEDPSMTLMLANSPRHPLQIQTVWVVVKYGAPAIGFGGILLMVLAWWRGRKRRDPAAA
ncbi:MAG: hypothetical protein K8T20_14500 [Planctomycetes bacterium]|nr:hypothetical protein [Planctomycetota bacterium]